MASTDLAQLISDVRRLDSHSRRRVYQAMKAAADVTIRDAKSKAEWSDRIPGTVKASVTQRRITMTAGGRKAPHALVYEVGGSHPLFGNRNHWYPVPKRPYLIPARDATSEPLAKALAAAIVATLRVPGGG